MQTDCNLYDHDSEPTMRCLLVAGGATAAEAAQHYARRGLVPVPVPHRGKNPGDRRAGGYGSGWQLAKIGPGDVPRYFGGATKRNVGVLLGGPSGGLVDVDLDCPEAVALGAALLPPTGAVFGRAGKPRSHRLYNVGPNSAGTEQWKDVGGVMLVELRSTGGQTVFPPSTHESGEPVAWDPAADGMPAVMDGQALRDAVATLGAAAMLARHYPDKGSRHHLAMALSSVLLRAGRPADDVRRLVAEVARVAGDDEVDDRVACVASTEQRLRGGGKATGVPTLKEILGGEVAGKILGAFGVGELMDVGGGGDDGPAVKVGEPAGPPEPPRAWPDALGEAAMYGLAGPDRPHG